MDLTILYLGIEENLIELLWNNRRNGMAETKLMVWKISSHLLSQLFFWGLKFPRILHRHILHHNSFRGLRTHNKSSYIFLWIQAATKHTTFNRGTTAQKSTHLYLKCFHPPCQQVNLFVNKCHIFREKSTYIYNPTH